MADVSLQPNNIVGCSPKPDPQLSIIEQGKSTSPSQSQASSTVINPSSSSSSSVYPTNAHKIIAEMVGTYVIIAGMLDDHEPDIQPRHNRCCSRMGLGKVRGQTPKVAKKDKKKKPRGHAHKRMQYNRRFITAVVDFGKKRGPNSSEKERKEEKQLQFTFAVASLFSPSTRLPVVAAVAEATPLRFDLAFVCSLSSF
ncbi:hypothetical protein EZV62_015232 [Acer yangbiense]|uniref:Uncharacterized protein n=1 Tax=Acer yangbiense TaxID=1000413 RepID=A0A5C7HV48_9ROSI|nr:hypothetical protein EZV62_015232 [Acer yangbiense]